MSAHHQSTSTSTAHSAARFKELRQNAAQVTFEETTEQQQPMASKPPEVGVPRVTDDKYPSTEKVLGLALVACVLCFPIGFAAVIYALLANVERAHMASSIEPPPAIPGHTYSAYNLTLGADGAAGAGAGAGGAAAEPSGGAGRRRTSSIGTSSPGAAAGGVGGRNRTSSHSGAGVGAEAGASGAHRGSGQVHAAAGAGSHSHLLHLVPLSPPGPSKEPPFIAHRRRMWRLNRIACLLSTAGLLSGILLATGCAIFLIYYFSRTECPLCSQQTRQE